MPTLEDEQACADKEREAAQLLKRNATLSGKYVAKSEKPASPQRRESGNWKKRTSGCEAVKI